MKLFKPVFIIGFILVIISMPLHSKAQKKVRASGFFEYLNNTWIPSNTYNQLGFNTWQNQSTIYNRVNLWYNPNDNIEFHTGLRTNFTFGPLVAQYNTLFDYAKLATYDDGYLDLTWKISSDNSNVLYQNMDRLFAKFTFQKIELTVGRQRINWGTNLVWNPNDIFNAFNCFFFNIMEISFYKTFDFNYIERPGSDAVHLQYYTGDFSSVEIAAKLSYRNILTDSATIEEKLSITSAALYKFNAGGYDFQVFGGYMLTDITAGLGWSGNIGGAGFTGEVSWFRDAENFADTSGQVVASISGNYIFKNQIMVNLSAIFNSEGATGPAYENMGGITGSLNTLFSSSLNVKNLTPSRLDVFAQVSYPATPLINVSLSGILNPYDMSAYIGPSANISLTDNISLMLVGQMFFGDKLTEFGDFGQMYFIDLKWNF
jgi:hypothetical protein